MKQMHETLKQAGLTPEWLEKLRGEFAYLRIGDFKATSDDTETNVTLWDEGAGKGITLATLYRAHEYTTWYVETLRGPGLATDELAKGDTVQEAILNFRAALLALTDKQ